LQKSPVVADDHESGAGDFQLRLEPLDRRQIEMIGRLVEKHNIGLRRERAGKRRSPRLAARKPRRIFLAVNPVHSRVSGRDGDHRWAKPAST